jgi:Ca2+-binding RTX toxin-like protein
MDNVFGTAAADTLIGNSAGNGLFGGGGGDILRGGGNSESFDDPYSFPGFVDADFLDGDFGWSGAATPADDTLEGGSGVTYACYCAATSGVTADLNSGKVTGGGGNDTLKDINGLVGSDFDDNFKGSNDDESFEGSTGHDTIDGRGGFDSFEGFYSAGVTADLAAGTASGDFPGAVNGVFDLYASSFSLSNIEDVWGSLEGPDNLTGDSKENRLYGMGGDDKLNGASGADFLDGAAGTDAGDGGVGDDLCVSIESATNCEDTGVAAPQASSLQNSSVSPTLRNTSWAWARLRFLQLGR